MTPSLLVLLGGIGTCAAAIEHLRHLKKTYPNQPIYECYKCGWYAVENTPKCGTCQSPFQWNTLSVERKINEGEE